MNSPRTISGLGCKRPAPQPPAFKQAVDEDTEHGKKIGENSFSKYTNLGLGSQILAVSRLVRGGEHKRFVREIVFLSGNPRDIANLAVLIFVIRNNRGGKLEKKLAFDIFFQLWKDYPLTAVELLPLFSHYGYWKDLLLLSEMAMAKGCANRSMLPQSKVLIEGTVALMRDQLKKDLASLRNYHNDLKAFKDDAAKIKMLTKKGPGVSLLAKWLPRSKSYFDKKIGFVNRLKAARIRTARSSMKVLQYGAKGTYQKNVAKVTKMLELPEVLLCAQQADEINFNKVPSKTTLCLTEVFLNQDKYGNHRSENCKRVHLAERCIDHVANNKRLKRAQLMPHEIVRKILKSNISPAEELILDAQWKDMWKTVVNEVNVETEKEGLEFNLAQMVPLFDMSTSMSGVPMEVSIALGIRVSEIAHPAFRDMVMTFEAEPKWQKLNPNNTIVKKVQNLTSSAPCGGSTNFERAYELVLQVCLDHNLARKDMPALIVFSDMPFNKAHLRSSPEAMPAMHDQIKAMVARVALRLAWTDSNPKPIVYWNLRNATGSQPVNTDEEGAVLLSGISPSLMKLVTNEEGVDEVEADGTVRTGEIRVTPEQVLQKMLDDSLYEPVREIIKFSNEGALVKYGELHALAREEEKADDIDTVKSDCCNYQI